MGVLRTTPLNAAPTQTPNTPTPPPHTGGPQVQKRKKIYGSEDSLKEIWYKAMAAVFSKRKIIKINSYKYYYDIQI